MLKVITDKNELYALDARDRGNITHLYLAFNDLHTHFSQLRKFQEFIFALTECVSLQYLNIQYNNLSDKEIDSIQEHCPSTNVKIHWEANDRENNSEVNFTPEHAYYLLIVAKHWQQKYPHIVKFHRIDKVATKVANNSSEMIINSPYSILILPTEEPVILIRTHMLPRKFAEYQMAHPTHSRVPFAQYEPIKDAVSIKIGVMLQYDNPASHYTKQVVLKTAFSIADTNSFDRESIFSSTNGIFISFQRRSKWQQQTFAKDYYITTLVGTEDAHEWLNQHVNQQSPILPLHIAYSIAMIFEVISAHILGIALFDVKPENFAFLGENAKFIDYGSAHVFSTDPIKLASDTKTSMRYASQELLDACISGTNIIVNAQPDHHALAIVLREFLYPYSMPLDNNWYFHRERKKNIDDALAQHFFNGLQKSISNPNIAMLLQQYIAEYPKHSFLEFAKSFFSTFPQFTKNVIAIRARSTIHSILQYMPVAQNIIDFLNRKRYLDADFMQTQFDNSGMDIDSITASINWMCKLQITATYLTIHGVDTSLGSIIELWGTPIKDICELDRPYEARGDVCSYLSNKLKI